MNFDYVLFHSPCSDGITGAFCAWLINKNATFVGLDVRNDFPVDLLTSLKGKRVIMIDIAFNRNIMIEIHRISSYFIVLDHHETNRENLKGLNFANFDMNKSGCMLAWQFFYPDTVMPDFIRYIGLRDLWKHKDIPDALYFTSGMPYTESFEEIYKYYIDSSLVTQTIKNGELLHNHMMNIVEQITSKAISCTWHGYDTKVVNCGCPFVSDVGDWILQRNPNSVVLLWTKQLGQPYTYSLRSNKTGPNVAELAKLYLNGGGHKSASGGKSNLGPDDILKN